MSRGHIVVAGLVAGSILTACTGPDAAQPNPADATEQVQEEQRESSPDTFAVSVPEEPVTVAASDDPVELALAASRALFDRAPVVVLAPEDDPLAQARNASVAVALGAPLLLSPADPTAEAELRKELGRLGVHTALDAPEAIVDGSDINDVTLPKDDAALAELLGRAWTRTPAVDPAQLTSAVATLDRDAPQLLTTGARSTPPPSTPPVTASASPSTTERETPSPGLPDLAPAGRPADVLVLADPAPAAAAAVATARAAGAPVHVLPGGDPRTDPATIEALARPTAPNVLALGAAFSDVPRLTDRLASAATGAQLPGGGQVLFPHRRLVALYGHPGTAALGVLGEQPVEQAVARAKAVAAEYQGLSEVPVVPTFEIITTVASSAAGPDGDYSNEADVDLIRAWAEAAGAAGVYVVLDLQPGTTDFLTQAKRYADILALPHVGLALDPEWRLRPGQRHLEQIGSVDVDEVNAVITWLADLTRERRLPQKLLVLHQFRLSMIAGRERLDTTRDELAVVIHADGNGSRGQKLETWNALRAAPPPGVWWAWKNFYDEDSPTFTPAETMALEPRPVLVSYQ